MVETRWLLCLGLSSGKLNCSHKFLYFWIPAFLRLSESSLQFSTFSSSEKKTNIETISLFFRDSENPKIPIIRKFP